MPKLAAQKVDTVFRNAKPKGTTYLIADGNGLYLKVTTDGIKRWIFLYRFHGTKRKIALPANLYPAMGAKVAREKAQAFRKCSRGMKTQQQSARSPRPPNSKLPRRCAKNKRRTSRRSNWWPKTRSVPSSLAAAKQHEKASNSVLNAMCFPGSAADQFQKSEAKSFLKLSAALKG